MVTKNTTGAANKGTEPTLPGSGFPMELNKAQDVTEGTATAPEAQRVAEHRADLPNAPTGLVGMTSRDTVAQIKIILQGALVQGRRFPDAYEAASNAVKQVNTVKLHPTVAAYKAEALDWLAGKDKEAKAALEATKAADKPQDDTKE